MKENNVIEYSVRVGHPEEWPEYPAKNRGKLRLDQYICSLQLKGLESRSRLKSLQVHVFQDGKPVKLSRLVAGGEQLQIRWQKPFDERRPVAMDLEIVHEDRSLILLNKPQGLAVHGAANLREASLVQGLIARYPELLQSFEDGAAHFRPGLVHRLDKDTSGLLLIARCPASLQQLRRQFAARKVHKTYYALVHGLPRITVGSIDLPLCRDPRAPWRYMCLQSSMRALISKKINASQELSHGAQPRCRDAHTEYQVLKHWPLSYSDKSGLSLLRLRPKTGRTHQLRVHARALGCPIVGDPIYGKPQRDAALQQLLPSEPLHLMLHAFRLEFCHPESGQKMRIHTATPQPFRDLLQAAADS